MAEPSTNGTNGRDGRGRFAPGNPGGPGNPHARKVAKLREALLAELTPEALRKVVRGLIAAAAAGDVSAARELLSRAVGPPTPADFIERLEQLEQRLGGTNKESWQ